MNDNIEYQINTKAELVDLFASDVINNLLLSQRLIEAITKEIRAMVEESVRNILPYEIENIDWSKIALELGIKDSQDYYLVIKNIKNNIIIEIAERHELAGGFMNNNTSYLPEKNTSNKKKFELLMD